MKILQYTHEEMDYGESYLWAGLCQICGNENVVTYPLKKIYYGMVADDYILDSGQTGFTGVPEYIKPQPLVQWSFEEIVNRINEFDLFVLSSPRTHAVGALRQIKETLGYIPRPLAFCDHEDGSNLKTNLIKEFCPDFIFKREIFSPAQNIYQLPFSSTCYDYPDNEIKDIDLFYSVGLTWPDRLQIRDLLKSSEALKKYNIEVRCNAKDPLLGYKEYIDKMSRSKINVISRGHGVDCCRTWEAFSFSGLVLSDRTSLVIPNPFTENVNVVYCDMNNLIDKIVYYLEHDEERIKIGHAGREHLLKYHTSEARARYFLHIVGLM